MKTCKWVLAVFAIALLGLAGAPVVEAASIRVTDLASSATITINDNDPNDLVGVTGVVAHSGSIGDFLVDFELGVTKPVVGSSGSPEMRLTVGATAGLTGGTLVVDFSETGFGPTGSLGGVATATGLGASAGLVTYNTFYDPGDVLFGGLALTSEGPSGPGVIVFSDTGSLLPTASYSLTQRLIISVGPGGSANLGSTVGNEIVLSVTNIPDGGWAVGLLGFALMGIEGLRRRYTRV